MESIERFLVTYAANAAWMTCLIAAATATLARLMRRSPASYRHALWVLALGVAVMIPLRSLRSELQIGGNFASGLVERTSAGAVAGRMSERPEVDSSLFDAKQQKRTVAFSPFAMGILAAAYAGFVVYRGICLCWAWYRTRRIVRDARAGSLTARQAAVVEGCFSAVGTNPIPIVCSAEVRGPAVVGAWRPRLVVPEWFFSDLSDKELACAVLHELAHVGRRDFLFNLAHELLALPILFHPATWLIKAQIEESREMACDEIAAGSLPSRAGYARSLLKIAGLVSGSPAAVRSDCAMGMLDAKTLEKRIGGLLEKGAIKCNAEGRIRKMAGACSLVAVSLIISSFSIEVARAGGLRETAKKFAGMWTGSFRGKPFVTLKLEEKAGKISGTVSKIDVQIGAGGELRKATAVSGADTVTESIPEGNVLHLTTVAQGRVSTAGGEFGQPIRYGLLLTDGDQAELQIEGGRPGMPIPAAWKMGRATETQ